MYYHSTRNNNEHYSASEAILKGMADDGGLFVPSEIPNVFHKMEKLSTLGYAELCHAIVCEFFPEFQNDAVFKKDILQAYDKFDSFEILNLKKLENSCYMELYHGPTCAFKDFALSVLPYEIRAAKRAENVAKDFAILTATSGDTGKAALEAFRGKAGFKIAVIYPKNGVSKMQELQMNSTEEENTYVCGLSDNFDGCQTLVKEMLADKYTGIDVTSANSINIGRLVPQIAYYFYTYAKLVKDGTIENGQKINFCIPTGNFGNILSGYIAKKMSLPVNKLICASNTNNILTDFFTTGDYDKRRKFFATKSPSMDILISSNFERLLWFATRDDEFVLRCMTELKEKGIFKAKELLPFLQDFVAGFATEAETAKEIKRVFKERNYLIDTHTAVASHVAHKLNLKEYTVVLSTASPFKFCSSVLESLGSTLKEDEFENLKELEKLSNSHAPYELTELKTKQTVHANVGDTTQVKAFVKEFLENTNV